MGFLARELTTPVLCLILFPHFPTSIFLRLEGHSLGALSCQ